jgi:Zn-dependent peptidase ImmA (M78 family)
VTDNYSPWDHVSSLPEVLVAFDRLEHADAYWEPDQQVILLDSRLSQAARRSRLAHELAHLDRGDECLNGSGDAERLARRQERRAEELAARRMIPLDQLADALCWAWHSGEIAEALNVDEALVVSRILTSTDTEKQAIEKRVAEKEEVA